MDSPFIITHGDCKDGFCSAWIAYNYYKKHYNIEPEIYYAKFGVSEPDVTGRDVLIFDFSFERKTLLEMKDKAKSLKVLDHHKSAKEDLEGLDFCIFDMERSGAQIVWDYFYPGIRRPGLVDYIADQDLWKFKLEDSKKINAAISYYDMNFNNWDYLSSIMDYWTIEWDKLCDLGRIILNQKDRDIKLICENAYDCELSSEFGQYKGIKVKVVNAPYLFASFAANELAKISTSNIGICWFKRSDGLIQYSFRSIGEVDVSLICKTIGGGGHKNASGAETKILLF